MACRSIKPFIHYYWQLRDSLGGYYSSQTIGKIAAYLWELMRHHDKLRYVQAAKTAAAPPWKNGEISQILSSNIFPFPYKKNNVVVHEKKLSFVFGLNINGGKKITGEISRAGCCVRKQTLVLRFHDTFLEKQYQRRHIVYVFSC